MVAQFDRYITGDSRVNSRNVSCLVISHSPKPNASGATTISTGIGCLSASPGSFGISIVVFFGAGGSRGGRL